MVKTRWRLFGNLRKGMEKMDKKDEIMLFEKVKSALVWILLIPNTMIN